MNTEFYKKQLSIALNDNTFFKDLEECNGWIAGGAILSIITNQEINDIDLYFKTIDDAYEFYLREIDNGYYCFCETKKSLLLTASNTVKLNLVLFDFFESPQAIFDSFDFTVCKAAFDGTDFYFDDSFWGDVASRRLVYTPSFKFPLSTALRIKKYEKRGYKISRNEFIKIILQITQRNITKEHKNSNVEDQYEPKMFADCGDVIQIFDRKVKKLTLNDYDGDKEPLKFPLIVYKWVDKEGDKYFSHAALHGSFEYKIGELVKDQFSRGLNILFEENVEDHPFSRSKDTVKIKMLVLSSDKLKIVGGELTATELVVVEEVIDDVSVNIESKHY